MKVFLLLGLVRQRRAGGRAQQLRPSVLRRRKRTAGKREQRGKKRRPFLFFPAGRDSSFKFHTAHRKKKLLSRSQRKPKTDFFIALSLVSSSSNPRPSLSRGVESRPPPLFLSSSVRIERRRRRRPVQYLKEREEAMHTLVLTVQGKEPLRTKSGGGRGKVDKRVSVYTECEVFGGLRSLTCPYHHAWCHIPGVYGRLPAKPLQRRRGGERDLKRRNPNPAPNVVRVSGLPFPGTARQFLERKCGCENVSSFDFSLCLISVGKLIS